MSKRAEKNGSDNYMVRNPKKRTHGEKLTAAQTMTVFVCWLRCGRSASETSKQTGVSQQGVHRLVSKGTKSMGIPPFKVMAEEYLSSGLMFIPAVHEEVLRHYKWDRRRACAETLLICEGLRNKVLEAIMSDKLKVRTPEDAAKVARAAKDLEEAYSTMAVAQDLVKGEVAAPKKASTKKDTEDLKIKSVEELERLAGVVPMKKKAE